MINQDSDANESAELFVPGLSFGQQQRLTQLLDQYLCALENGETVDVQLMLHQNPDIAEALTTYLQKLDGLRGIAPGFQDHGELEPLVSGDNPGRVQSLELGDYTILRELGRGGMGIVYEAVQRSLDRRVALKLLPMVSMLDPRQITRFKNESNAAAQLQHPNIVPVFSVGVHRGIHYYAMQFIEGQAGDQWIDSNGGSAAVWRDAVQMTIEAASALHCAHEGGIVHRDVKPSNLMIDESGKTWVTDFGLARCQNNHSVTLSGNLVGTMRYMSPEQATGRAELIDHRTDVYSLGATLYEMLTGEPAFPGDDGPSVLRRIIDGSTPKLRRIAQQLPADLEVVLLKAMASNKDDRYESASAFADDLTAVLEDRPTVAKPLSLPQIAYRWTRRHQRLAVGSALAAGLVCLLVSMGVVANGFVLAEKNRAVKTSYERSEMFFQQAQEAVDQLGSRYANQLASVPGAEHIRRSMLQDTLEYYQRFVASAAGDPDLMAQLAITQSRIGGLVKELESPSAAVPHLQDSANLYRQLISQDGKSIGLRKACARNLDQLGLAQLASNQMNGAAKSFQEALQIQSELVEQGADVEGSDLARTHSNLGLMYLRSGQPDFAEQHLRLAMEGFDAELAKNDRNVLAIRGFAAALGNLSSLVLNTDPQNAITLLKRAIALQLKIAEASPAKLVATSELASSYNSLGSAHLAVGDTVQANEAFSSAVRIMRQLHTIAPLVDAYRFDLAMSLNNQASVLQQQSQRPLAMAAVQEAIKLQSTCLQSEPHAPALSRLAVMWNNLGKIHEASEDHSKASDAFSAAVLHQQRAIEIDAQADEQKQLLLQHYSNLLRAQVRCQNYQDAALTSQQYRIAAEDSEQLVAVAKDLASISIDAKDRWREHAAKEIASTLLAVRELGVQLDPQLLSHEPFSVFANAPRLQRAMKP